MILKNNDIYIHKKMLFNLLYALYVYIKRCYSTYFTIYLYKLRELSNIHGLNIVSIVQAVVLYAQKVQQRQVIFVEDQIEIKI